MAFTKTLGPDEAKARLETWLAKHRRNANITAVQFPESSGLSAETIMITASWEENGETTEHRLVARVKPSGATLFMNYNFAMEFAILAALDKSSNVPVPGVVIMETDEAVLGAPFYLMTHSDGKAAPDDPPFTMEGWVLELSAEQRRALNANGLQALVDIHACDPEKLGLTGHLSKPQYGADALSQQLGHWRASYEWTANGTTHELIEKGLNWLEQNRPAIQNPKLSWGDARIGNILFNDDQSVSAVLDWEMAGLGDPELDLAWWVFLNRHHSVGVGAELPEGLLSEEETLALYQSLSGHKVKNFNYYMVFAGIRMCILVWRAANIMREAGLLPEDSQMGWNNPATNLTSALLGEENSSAEGEVYFGKR